MTISIKLVSELYSLFNMQHLVGRNFFCVVCGVIQLKLQMNNLRYLIFITKPKNAYVSFGSSRFLADTLVLGRREIGIW